MAISPGTALPASIELGDLSQQRLRCRDETGQLPEPRNGDRVVQESAGGDGPTRAAYRSMSWAHRFITPSPTAAVQILPAISASSATSMPLPRFAEQLAAGRPGHHRDRSSSGRFPAAPSSGLPGRSSSRACPGERQSPSIRRVSRRDGPGGRRHSRLRPRRRHSSV